MSKLTRCTPRTQGTSARRFAPVFLAAAAAVALDLVVCQSATAQPNTNRLTVYVADFTSSSAADSASFLSVITDDFEALLSDSGGYSLLERRRARDLELQVRNEAQLTSNPALIQALRGRGAQAVVFGQLQDDVDSGEYVFRASLIRLDSTVVWRRNASLSRGLVRDRDSRIRALRKLIGGPSGTTTVGDRAPDPNVPLSTAPRPPQGGTNCDAATGAGTRVPLGLQGGDTRWVARGCRAEFLDGTATVTFIGTDRDGKPVLDFSVEGVTRRLNFLYNGQLAGLGHYALTVVDMSLDGSRAAVSVAELP